MASTGKSSLGRDGHISHMDNFRLFALLSTPSPSIGLQLPWIEVVGRPLVVKECVELLHGVLRIAEDESARWVKGEEKIIDNPHVFGDTRS